MKAKVKVGIIGSQFEADIHAASFQLMPEEAEVEITVQRASSSEAVNGEGKATLLREIAASMKANSFTGDPPRLSGDGLHERP